MNRLTALQRTSVARARLSAKVTRIAVETAEVIFLFGAVSLAFL